jgi:hypothetical protein
VCNIYIFSIFWVGANLQNPHMLSKLQLKIIWQNKGRGKISIGVECKAVGLRPIGCYVTSIKKKKKKKSQWKCVLDKSGWCSQPKWMVELFIHG